MIARPRRAGGVPPEVRTLFDQGTTVGLSDGELLGRFVDRDRGDDAPAAGADPAFVALVERHGPMVLRVCRAILRDEHDAQDAFQATFLVLVRRASAVRRQESVASWLHGVALRVAARARVDLARRRRHERLAVEGQEASRPVDEGGIVSSESAAIVHEELGRLPERYRAAVVLCYLEGQTCEAAAHRLGWPVGTVKSRLARGRERLRSRLTRRGLGPEQPERAESTATAVLVPPELAQATVVAMRAIAAGRRAVVASAVLAWTDHTLRNLMMVRILLISALLIPGLLFVRGPWSAVRGWAIDGAGDVRQAGAANDRAPKAGPAAVAVDDGKKTEIVTVRVVDTQGQAAAGVEVEVLGRFLDKHGLRYRTGADGRVRVPLGPGADRSYGTRFIARADDRTLGWAYRERPRDRKDGADADADVVPIVLLPRTHKVEGSVVDRDGRPVGGVRMHVMTVVRGKGPYLNDYSFGPGDSRIGMAVTDADGRYAIDLPEGSSATLLALHPLYAGPAVECGADERTIPPVKLEAAGGIVGTVVDATTGQPVAGATLYAGRIERYDIPLIATQWTATDGQGRYRIGGLPPGVYNVYLHDSPRGERFPAAAVEGVRVESGLEAPADLKLVEGRRIEGTVTDAGSGRPMAGTEVFCSNPSLPGSGNEGKSMQTDEHGRFVFFVPPGLSCVYRRGSTYAAVKGRDTRTLIVAADRDPEPVKLVAGDATARPVFAAGRQAQFRVKAAAVAGIPREGERFLIGRVVDQDGAPVAAVVLNFAVAGQVITCATDRQGVFRARRVPPSEYLLDLSRKGYRPTTARMSPEVREVEITLERLPESSY